MFGNGIGLITLSLFKGVFMNNVRQQRGGGWNFCDMVNEALSITCILVKQRGGGGVIKFSNL